MTEQKKKISKLDTDRTEYASLSVPLFKDELDTLELFGTVREIQVQIRQILAVADPMRRRAGKSGSMSQITRGYKNASDEQKQAILDILASEE